MAIDAVCLLAGTALFWNAANPATRPLNWLQAGSIAATMAIVFHSVVRSTRGYRVERYQKFRRSIADTLGGLIIASLPALLVVWAFLPDPRGAMGWMAWWIWVSFLSLVLGRQTVRAILIVVRDAPGVCATHRARRSEGLLQSLRGLKEVVAERNLWPIYVMEIGRAHV